MKRAVAADERPDTILAMPGLEADNLLGFLALLGVLRSIEEARPSWRPRVSWAGPPWMARLHVAGEVREPEVAAVAHEGIVAIAKKYDVDGRANVSFPNRDELRTYFERTRDADPTAASLAVALTAEHPLKKDDAPYAGPLVMMFGQGHQNFLERLVTVPLGSGGVASAKAKQKREADADEIRKLEEALFAPWKRADEADGFRWDPDENQQYALRYGNPSKAGAAPTTIGANRLAAIGVLTFRCAPRQDRLRARGVVSDREGVRFIWPIWRTPLSLSGVEALLSHPALIRGAIDEVRAFGVLEIMSARRIANGKYMNVTRARPAAREARTL